MLKKLITAICLVIMPVSLATAQIEVDVTRGTGKALPIAVPNFGGNDAVSRQIAEVVRNDLESTGLFTICLLYTSPSPRDATLSRMPSSA